LGNKFISPTYGFVLNTGLPCLYRISLINLPGSAALYPAFNIAKEQLLKELNEIKL
jgi:hypothetical protein